MVEEMGITPDRAHREKRHSLRTVGLMYVFIARTKRLSAKWAEKKEVQKSLARKFESMRGAVKSRR
jgi:hypothetical protein